MQTKYLDLRTDAVSGLLLGLQLALRRGISFRVWCYVMRYGARGGLTHESTYEKMKIKKENKRGKNMRVQDRYRESQDGKA